MLQYYEIFLLAIGISFDTFAVSISTGLAINHIKFWQGVRVAVVLAFFQTLMPLIGWIGGIQITKYLSDYDHWIAFTLLFILGVNMIIDSFREEAQKRSNPLLMSVLIWMALATSIDALVVGLSLGLLKINLLFTLGIIGSVTFITAMVGMLLGKNISGRFGKKFEILGGIILISIGIKIILEHLN